jgi:hypothetical protein
MADDLHQLRSEWLKQHPSGDPERKLYVDLLAGVLEVRHAVDAEFRRQVSSQQRCDPRSASNLCVAVFSDACATLVRLTATAERALYAAEELTSIVDGFLKWFADWCTEALPPHSADLAKELSRVLNRRLLEVLADTETQLWKAVKERESDSSAVSLRRQAFLDQIHATKGMSVPDIADRHGPSYNTVMKWAKGATTSRTPYIRGKIARALKIDVSAVPE